MNISITEQLLKRLGYQNEPKILDKTTEFLRLLDLKSSKIVSNVGDYAKTVMCINFAAEYLNLDFDNEDGVKASGLKKSTYLNFKRTFEKILDLKKPINVNEICVQLNLNEVQKLSNNYYDYFCKTININDIDNSHPQYASMAVYQAAKKMKKKISKPKFLYYSHLRPSQWTILEQHWNKMIIRYEEDLKNLKVIENQSNVNSKKEDTIEENNKIEIDNKKKIIEDYDTWKARMLKTAEIQFKLERKSNEPEFLDKKWLCKNYSEWNTEEDKDYFLF